jgi:hypothetical protein
VAGILACAVGALAAHLIADEDVGSAWAVAAEHDAGWVTDRVGEDSKARLALTADTHGAEREQFLLSLVGGTDADIEVQLLRTGRVWLARWEPFGGQLERQLPAAGSADDHAAVEVFVDLHAQHLAIELREGAGVRGVEHCLLEVSDHTESMPARRRNGLRRSAVGDVWLRRDASDGYGFVAGS